MGLESSTNLAILAYGFPENSQPPADARPFVTYDNGLTFHFNGEEVRVFLAPPAHTGAGNLCNFAT
jgi:hypothetical protein